VCGGQRCGLRKQPQIQNPTCRKGLDPELLQELLKPLPPVTDSSSSSSSSGRAPEADADPVQAEVAAHAPRRLVYLSCGYAALERDAAALVAGGWRVASAEAFTFFPGTDHLETLAVFER